MRETANLSTDIRHSDFVIRHSLVVVARLFDRANFVAEFRSLLVFFGRDGFLHFAAEADQLRLLFGAAARRTSALCRRGAFRRGCSPAAAPARRRSRCNRAGSPAGPACEIQKRDAADRAGALIEPGQLLGRFADREMLGQQTCHRRQHFGGVIGRGRRNFARIPRTGAARSVCRPPNR